MTTAEMKARRLIAARTTAQLIADYEATDAAAEAAPEAAPVTVEPAMVTGWILDELQKRDPEAYDAWMDDENPYASPRTYFAA